MPDEGRLLTEEELRLVIEAVVTELDDEHMFFGSDFEIDEFERPRRIVPFRADEWKRTISFHLRRTHCYQTPDDAADELEPIINRHGAKVSHVSFVGDSVIFDISRTTAP